MADPVGHDEERKASDPVGLDERRKMADPVGHDGGGKLLIGAAMTRESSRQETKVIPDLIGNPTEINDKTKNMKKILSIITALTLFTGSAFADEGMWLLPLLEKMNGKALSEAGCELTPKEIYNINNTSLKDAIVQFGGGCTGEIISDQGLLVTNHHCGYRNIQQLRSV